MTSSLPQTVVAEALTSRVVIVGAGHAGTTAAATLRQVGHQGTITLVGDEEQYPYHRPPISKAYLHGETAPELLRAPSYYEDQSIDLRLGCAVQSVDLQKRSVKLDDTSEVAFDDLILATGARARNLPMRLPARGWWSLRTYSDAVKFRTALASSSQIVIIGGGFVGLEVAAAARRHNCEVTVIERENRLLQRVASPALSEALTQIHRQNGVKVLVNTEISQILSGPDDEVDSVILEDGTRLACDALVIGVGAEPRDELLREIGAECDGGVIVDDSARTTLPRIYAIGDVTRREVPKFSGRIRLESIPNTTEQAKQAASAIVGHPVPSAEIPWFWSDQYEEKIKIAGLIAGSVYTVIRGDSTSKAFAVYHFNAEDQLIAVETLNAPKDFMAGKKWISTNASLALDRLADNSISLRDLVPA